ncbi:MAG: aminopeptidase P family protein [Planctomycetota bacterium]|nr:MAG: aminopeptidase P family protein [Planctomycetota bacterium]
MNSKIIKKRIRTIRHRLREKQINCLIATKPPNVTYTTGFLGDDSWAVLTARAVYLLTDSRYIEQAKDECLCCKIIQRSSNLPEAAAELVKKLKSVRTVAVEKSTSLASFDALKKQLKGRLKTAPNIIESARTIKDNTEIAAIRAAARIATQALRKIRRHIKTGITENELAGTLDFQVRKLGARNSFETIVAFGANASRPHHQPSRRKLKRNDTILIDFGVRYKSYCCDLTRCFSIGRSSPLYKKAYNAVREAQIAAIKSVKAGVEIRHVDAAAREVIASHDFPVYGHPTGHGLGLEVHEEPAIVAKTKGKLKAGMVFTIEPGVYIPRKLGVRIEDNILVTDSGCKILTRSYPQKPLQLT